MATVDIPKTYGALLLGGLFASLLSGFVIIQIVVYFKLYPEDRFRVKTLVLTVWLLDTCHTVCIWISLWSYLIDNYGNAPEIDVIHWSLALSITFPAILTFLVHSFLAHRIFMLSKRNYLLTAPILALAVLRLASACVSYAFMIRLRTFTSFGLHVRFIFTTGLSLSSAVDVIITASLIFLLRTSRTGATILDAAIDALIRYTFETASLTCAGTLSSILCWLIIPHNLIFMGLHFIIGKFRNNLPIEVYANSLLVTLNMRDTIRRTRYSGDHGVRLLQPRRPAKLCDSDQIMILSSPASSNSMGSKKKVEVVVEKSVYAQRT